METNIQHHNAESHFKIQTMEGMVIYHDSQVARIPRNHLEKLKIFPIYLFGEVNQRVKLILERHFVNYETPAVYPEHAISGILHLQQCEVLPQNMITSQRTSLVTFMIEVMKTPLDSYEDLLFVQERLAIYYSMLERSLLLSHGQHDIKWCQQFTAHQLSIIGNNPKTLLHKALYLTFMEVKHKADCEQSLATIDFINRIAKLFGYGSLRGTSEVPGHCNLFLREVESDDDQRDRRPASAAKGARRGPCWWLALNVYTLRKSYLTTKGIKIGISIQITTELCNPSYMPADSVQSTHLRRSGDPSIGTNINPCQGNV